MITYNMLILFLSSNFLTTNQMIGCKKKGKFYQRLLHGQEVAKCYPNFTKPASGPISEVENRSGSSHVNPCTIISNINIKNNDTQISKQN